MSSRKLTQAPDIGVPSRLEAWKIAIAIGATVALAPVIALVLLVLLVTLLPTLLFLPTLFVGVRLPTTGTP
jgi:hypothetical protein